MTVKTGQSWAGSFVTLDATGAKSTPSVGPAGVLYIDGVADDATVTITGSNPYKWSVTLPTLTAGQRVEMYITATISGVSTANFVAVEQADTSLISDIDTDVWSYTTRTLTQSATSIASAVSGSSITATRGDTWSIDVDDLTLDSNLIQFAIKKSAGDTDDESILMIDTTTGLLYLNGAAGTASDGSLSYAGTTLTITVKASATAQIPFGTYVYGIQSITAGGTVAESYGGKFSVTSDVVRSTT